MLKKLYRSALPSSLRSKIRFGLRSLPHLLHDLPSDLFGLNKREIPVPGPFLRARVGLTTSRDEYAATGLRLFQSLDETVRPALGVSPGEADVFDFGCGCGRIAAWVQQQWSPRSLSGFDPDRKAVHWCRSSLKGTFVLRPLIPPLPFSENQFHLIYAVSVFTHLPGKAQRLWARELVRLLRPAGILAVSNLSSRHTFERPELSIAQHTALAEGGFLHVPGDGRFNSASSFHSFENLAALFAPDLEVVSQVPFGLAGYQDLSIFRKISAL